MFPVRIMCMRVDSCSVAQIEASTESNRPFLRDPLLTVWILDLHRFRGADKGTAAEEEEG